MIIVFALLLTEAAMIYFAITVSNNNQKNFKSTVTNLATTVSETVDVELYKNVKEKVKTIYDSIPVEERVTSEEWDSEEWKAYTAKFTATLNEEKDGDQDYKDLLKYLRTIEAANVGDIDCVYFTFLDPETEYFIYVADSATGEDQCPPGCIDYLREENRPNLTDPEYGFPAYTTNTEEYGWLMTAGKPIHDGNTVVGYAMVDLSMEVVRANQAVLITKLFFYLLATTMLIAVLGIVVIHFILIKPLNQIMSATKSYDVSKPEENHQTFSNLNIRTHDELRDLSNSLKTLENDVYEKINELVHTNNELVKSQQVAEEMTELANKDALTGVRNKIAYNELVKELNREIKVNDKLKFAIVMIDLNYLKLINDDFGHDNGDQALIKLCNIICNTFAHSPVFRVGGDEFVVVVRNQDYRNIDKLVAKFNDEIYLLSLDKDLTRPEQVSAAIGYAIYSNEIDNNVESVFKLADTAMYERKHYMKENDNEK